MKGSLQNVLPVLDLEFILSCKIFVNKEGEENTIFKEDVTINFYDRLKNNVKKIAETHHKQLFINSFQVEHLEILSVKVNGVNKEYFDSFIKDNLFENTINKLQINIKVPQQGKIELIRKNKKFFYEGYFKRGMPEGFGKLSFAKNVHWVGEWKEGVEWNGIGSIEWKDELNKEWIYNGELLGGKPHGKGKKLDNEKKLMWQGEWKEGLEWNGKGLCTWIDKAIGVYLFYGKLIDREPHGEGQEMDRHRNIVWSGEWLKGVKKLGKGRTRYIDVDGIEWDYTGEIIDSKPKDGDIEIFNLSKKCKYEGKFFNGRANGRGRRIDEKKNVLWDGEFRDGKEWIGRGFCEWVDEGNFSWIYNGELFNGNPHGMGKKLDERNHVLWEGEWMEGKEWNGQGITENNEFTFFGEYVEGKLHGHGKKFAKIGELIWEGDYRDGVEWSGSGSCQWTSRYGNVFKYKGMLQRKSPNGKGSIYLGDKLIWKGEWKEGKFWEGKGAKLGREAVTVWEGHWRNGKEWLGRGRYKYRDTKGVWNCQGEIYNGMPMDGRIIMESLDKNIHFKGYLKNQNRFGKGVLTEYGKEYYVQYDENGEELINERKRTFEGIRIMIVGCENVGKTSFKKRLIGSSSEEDNRLAFQSVKTVKREEDMTHGVDITEWFSSKHDRLLSIWDFAGHEEYHVAHSFFFSSGCVYLLLFDCSKEIDKIISDNKLLYWFHFLQTQVKNQNTILLIATKFDELLMKFSTVSIFNRITVDYEKVNEHMSKINKGIKKVIEENDIKINFHIFREDKNVESYFSPLCNLERDLHKSGIFKIRETIMNEYYKAENSVLTNLRHYLVLKAIEKLSGKKKNCKESTENPFVEVSYLKEYLIKEMEEESVEASDQIELILVDLHKLGVIIYFDNEILKETIITSPFWFNKVFKVILDHGRKKIGEVLEFTMDALQKRKERGKMKCTYNIKNSESEIRKVLYWLKGTANKKLSIREMWEIKTERDKMRLDKISFQNLLIKLQEIEELLINEGNHKAINLYKKVFSHPIYYEISQVFHSINYQSMIIIVKEIIGVAHFDSGAKRQEKEVYLKKMNFMIKILINLDLVFPKQRIERGEEKNENPKQTYSIPLLFPSLRPKQLIRGKLKMKEITKKKEWKIKYNLPFKPSSMWKMLFLRIRKVCVST
eukprot:TRINITY_DN2038_c0_g1_i1.p1 TRINITY_DN2038_c0_g1~~TRINITY_DN2038_c0_g1_i1.p1  ORF type:complete len:1330 (-),score=374.41 TRINITY_DN2038_c0_g1_i1:37-3537(-)